MAAAPADAACARFRVLGLLASLAGICGARPGSHRKAPGLVLALVLLPAHAAGPYLEPGAVDLARLLPPPPASGSEAGRRDLQAVLALQSERGAAEVAAALADREVSVFRFAEVLGARFVADAVPRTAALAAQVCRESVRLTAPAKEHWARPRPAAASEAVKPVIADVQGASYPSGHASCGHLWAIVLADMLPERRGELFARGRRYGINRVLAGVHYPSDAEAGRLAATAIATALYASPSFRRDLEAARAELRAVLGFETPQPEAPAAGIPSQEGLRQAGAVW
jgi:acid phosphatase (class A)